MKNLVYFQTEIKFNSDIFLHSGTECDIIPSRGGDVPTLHELIEDVDDGDVVGGHVGEDGGVGIHGGVAQDVGLLPQTGIAIQLAKGEVANPIGEDVYQGHVVGQQVNEAARGIYHY